MSSFWRTVFKRHIVFNAICVALVVGTLLNLINQGQQFLTGSEISWGHVLLNFLVPYCVANYSATKNKMQRSELNARKNKK